MPNEQPRPEPARQPRRTYDETFKRDAVALLLKGDKRVKQLAQELGVSQWNLRDWREHYGPSAPAKTTEQLAAELRTLRRENDSLRTQRDILKKTLGILVEPSPNATRA
jgi:transposase